MNYEDFVDGKLSRVPPTGLSVIPELHPSLFPFQRDLVTWALRRGRCAIFANTGLGKTRQELEWARCVALSTGGRVLILAPLAVGAQTVREAAAIGIDARQVRYSMNLDDDAPAIIVTNYDRVHHFDPAAFAGIVCDECFAEGTLIDTSNGPRPIETFRVGDRILNASGEDIVSDVHRREVPYGVKVTIEGASCIASPNHPFFTQRGWVGARDLRAGDCALATSTAVRMVRRNFLPESIGELRPEILRDVLLSELANECAGTQGEGAYARNGEKDRSCEESVAVVGQPECCRYDRADSCPQPISQPRDKSEDLPPIERDRARTFRAWGQWSRDDRAAIATAGCTWVAMASGICFAVGSIGAEAGLPNALQDRLSESRSETCNRSGWFLSRVEATHRREEGREAAFAWVDGIEILEPGHPELDRLRSPDGKLYFYDLGGTWHPSFSVNGSLVHNSSIIKNSDSKTFAKLTKMFAETPFRLCASATPSPNDYTELGTHAEFLGICTREEMLAEYFCHDGGETQKWRLKGHARGAFWKWVAGWGALVRMPSDLGYDDAGYILPPLVITQHTLPADQSQAHEQGLLFAEQAKTLTERRAARKISLLPRVQACADVVLAEPGESWVIWCELNAEADALAEAIPCAVEIRGTDDVGLKEQRLIAFSSGEIRVLISKSKITGFGLNWQHCARMCFVGVKDSYESTYQAIRRCWRFGQKRSVYVHVFASELEGEVVRNLERKERDAFAMAEALSAETREVVLAEILGQKRQTNTYEANTKGKVPAWM